MKPEIKLVLDYAESHNAHQIDAVMRTIAQEIRYEMTGVWVRQGFEEVRMLEEWDAVFNGVLKLAKPKLKGNTVTCTAKETNDWLQTVGVPAIIFDSYRFVIEGGKIVTVKAKLNSKSERDIDRAVNNVMHWAFETHPALVKQIMLRGQFIYGKEQAVIFKGLLEKWVERQE